MPTIGKFSWGIMLCKFADQPQEPSPPHFFSDLIFGKAEGSLNDYWTTMSYSKLDMSDSTVYGWITMPVARDQAFLSLSRWAKTQKCYDAVDASLAGDFGARMRFETHDGYLAIVNANAGDGGRTGNRILLDPGGWRSPTFIAHEMGHVLGLDHSFDTNSAPWDAADDNRPGAYGDSRDIMSAQTFAGLPATFQSRFGTAGPGLNALTRESFGWMPTDRIWTVAQNAGEDWGTQIEVAALDDLASPGNLMLKITSAGAYQGSPLAPMIYTVEFRPKVGWDAGIVTDAVVIHMIRQGDHPRIAWSSGNTQDWVPKDRFVDLARSMGIDVAWVADDKSAASVFIESGSRAKLAMISVKKSLAHKFDLTKGLRVIKPSPPFPSDSLRARLLDNPPQFAP